MTTYSLPFLQEKRSLGDAMADELIQAVVDSGQHVAFSSALHKLKKNKDYHKGYFKDLSPELQEHIDAFFKESSQLPKWLDKELLKIGNDVFSSYVPLIMMLLQYKSLPLCYSCKNGAKLLYMTGNLSSRYGSNKIFGRLVETAQMVINTMSPDSFEPSGKGFIMLQKVRLIHALVRWFVNSPHHNRFGWNNEENGLPINQEDLTGTLMAFSAMTLEGLKQLHIPLTKKEEQGYMHAWKLVGYLNGIDEDLLPDSFEEGKALAIAILKHQAGPSHEGTELTKACIELHKKMTGGIIWGNMPDFMVRYFLSDTSKALGTDISAWVGAKQNAPNYEKTVQLFSKLGTLGVVNKAILKGYHTFDNFSHLVDLSIPKGLGPKN